MAVDTWVFLKKSLIYNPLGIFLISDLKIIITKKHMFAPITL